MIRRPPKSTLFPYPTPFRSLVYMPQSQHVGVSRRIRDDRERDRLRAALRSLNLPPGGFILRTNAEGKGEAEFAADRSEEHTSELQSRSDLVCRLLLEKKNEC